jgi:hypothetical protein
MDKLRTRIFDTPEVDLGDADKPVASSRFERNGRESLDYGRQHPLLFSIEKFG